MKTPLLIKRLSEFAIPPRYAHGPGVDNGIDLFAAGSMSIRAGETKIVPTGWAMKVQPGFGLFVLPRSGTSLKTDIRIANAPGLVDQSYREEVGVLVWNKGEEEIYIAAGERVAQAVILETPAIDVFEVEQLDETKRKGGFGSTGQ